MPVPEERPPTCPVDPWTSADVDRWLITAFRAMPYTPIYAPRGNTLEAVDLHTPDATFDIVAFTGTVLGDKSEDRKILLLWARAKATGGEIGGSIAQYCDEKEMARSTFDRRRQRVSEKVASAKNFLEGRSRG